MDYHTEAKKYMQSLPPKTLREEFEGNLKDLLWDFTTCTGQDCFPEHDTKAIVDMLFDNFSISEKPSGCPVVGCRMNDGHEGDHLIRGEHADYIVGGR